MRTIKMLLVRIAILAAVVLLAGSCVDSQDAHNGVIRIVNATPDALPIRLLADDQIKTGGHGFGSGSAFVVLRAGGHQVEIEEFLPADSDPDTKTLVDQPTEIGVGEELTFVVVGQEAAVELLEIEETTAVVPSGQTRLQFVHAAFGAPAFDAYVIEPDAEVATSTPFVTGLAYKEWTPQATRTAGGGRIVLTAPGDPATVLYDSGTLFLPLEGSLLLAAVPNTSVDAGAARPFALIVLSGSGSTPLLDKDTGSALRVVNASPGTYSVDVFLNAPTVGGTARQTCDPLTSEDDTFLEVCATAFTSISAFSPIDAGSYQVKLQKTADAGVEARGLVATFAAGTGSTVVLTGLLADTATATLLGIHTMVSARPAAAAAQLRIVDVSLAADAAVAGDPTTDRLELYITPPGAVLPENETPDFFGLQLGSDTGYLLQVAGSYKIWLTRTDTATDDPPEELGSLDVTLANGGVYTLLIADSTGGVQPLQFLSIEDDPTP